MKKQIKTLLVFILLFVPFLRLDAQERIVVSTYYPSPYGSYRDLDANQMRIGASYTQGATVAPANGLIVEGSVGIGTTAPLGPAPNNASGNLDVNDVYLRSNATWVSQASGISRGAVMFFNLSSCPNGWSEFTAARGMYLVGMPAGGTLGGTPSGVFTPLSDQENRPAGAHTHGYTAAFMAGGSGTTGSETGVSAASASANTDDGGLIGGTTSPYIQLLACEKN